MHDPCQSLRWLPSGSPVGLLSWTDARSQRQAAPARMLTTHSSGIVREHYLHGAGRAGGLGRNHILGRVRLAQAGLRSEGRGRRGGRRERERVGRSREEQKNHWTVHLCTLRAREVSDGPAGQATRHRSLFLSDLTRSLRNPLPLSAPGGSLSEWREDRLLALFSIENSAKSFQESRYVWDFRREASASPESQN